FWMVEGEHDLIGRYGQRANALPWSGCQLLTFGQYTIGDTTIVERDDRERAALTLAERDANLTPKDLADSLQVPILSTSDTERWQIEVTRVASDLLAIYQDERKSIRALYSGLDATTYLDDGFGEFFCWYDHLAYAHAIDALADAGMLTIPPLRFSDMIWQELLPASAF
ncbi:MAG TPA: hypothetical protein VHV31_01095, partial [Nitrolancea sp.]|nr:hypothetical protein [Nitrolancea sp.]